MKTLTQTCSSYLRKTGCTGLTPALVDKLIEAGKIKNLASLYELTEKDLQGVGAPDPWKIHARINLTRTQHAENFIQALGLDGMTEDVAFRIAHMLGGRRRLSQVVDRTLFEIHKITHPRGRIIAAAIEARQEDLKALEQVITLQWPELPRNPVTSFTCQFYDLGLVPANPQYFSNNFQPVKTVWTDPETGEPGIFTLTHYHPEPGMEMLAYRTGEKLGSLDQLLVVEVPQKKAHLLEEGHRIFSCAFPVFWVIYRNLSADSRRFESGVYLQTVAEHLYMPWLKKFVVINEVED